jgi:hypothetical protein
MQCESGIRRHGSRVAEFGHDSRVGSTDPIVRPLLAEPGFHSTVELDSYESAAGALFPLPVALCRESVVRLSSQDASKPNNRYPVQSPLFQPSSTRQKHAKTPEKALISRLKGVAYWMHAQAFLPALFLPISAFLFRQRGRSSYGRIDPGIESFQPVFVAA